jgi:hypothetical protein
VERLKIMSRAAAEVMQDVVYAAVIDAILALKDASKGLPNNLLRDLNAIHANTTFADLPPGLQASLGASVRAAFTKLLKEGYSVAPSGSVTPAPRSPAPPRREGGHGARPGGGANNRGPRPGGAPGPRGPRSGPGGGRPGGGGGRPGGGGPGGGGGPRGGGGGRGPKPKS